MKNSILAAIAISFIGLSALAEEPSKDQREKMAATHEKMAQCLRSDKSINDCHNEMREQCNQANFGECPMMGQTKRGMMRWNKQDDSKVKGK